MPTARILTLSSCAAALSLPLLSADAFAHGDHAHMTGGIAAGSDHSPWRDRDEHHRRDNVEYQQRITADWPCCMSGSINSPTRAGLFPHRRTQPRNAGAPNKSTGTSPRWAFTR